MEYKDIIQKNLVTCSKDNVYMNLYKYITIYIYYI